MKGRKRNGRGQKKVVHGPYGGKIAKPFRKEEKGKKRAIGGIRKRKSSNFFCDL